MAANAVRRKGRSNLVFASGSTTEIARHRCGCQIVRGDPSVRPRKDDCRKDQVVGVALVGAPSRLLFPAPPGLPALSRAISHGARVVPRTVKHLDEARGWDVLHDRFLTKRINHQDCYSDGDPPRAPAVRRTRPRRQTARTKRSRSSPASAVPRSASTTISPAATSRPMPARWRGGRTTAAFRTVRSTLG